MVFSDYTKRRIQFFHREGLLPSRIQKELEKEGIKSSVVGIWKFLQRSETYGTIERRPGSGRPRKADSTVEAVIEVEPLTWNATALAAFNATKEALANASLLSYPTAEAPTCLMTDASDTAVGAVLQQYIDGTWHPISFFSKKMTPAKTRYSKLCTSQSDTFATYWKANCLQTTNP